MDLLRRRDAPNVGSVMTPFPHFVHSNDSVERVEQLMEDHRIRHVPVQDDDHVVGLISERDLHRLVNPSLPSVDKEHIKARVIMLREPYVVDFETSLAEVATEMADRHIGSAVVLKHGKLAGILSTTDVCRLLAEALESVFGEPDGNDAA